MNAKLSLLASVVSVAVAGGALALSIQAKARADSLEVSPAAGIDYAKLVEAKVAVTELAWGIALCAERTGQLPASAAKVPDDLGRVRGQMYQSRLSDWGDEAYVCADFHLARPQRFQYQWQLDDGGMQGSVVAEADYNGDGGVDHSVRLMVRCKKQEARLRCRPDPMPTAPRPLNEPTPRR